MLSSSPQKYKPQRHLVSGFMGVLILLLGLAVVVLLRSAEINRHIRTTVAEQNNKVMLVVAMRDAMRQRQVGLRDMVILTDVFEKDRAWQTFYFAASQFMSARQRLIQTGLPSEQALALDRLTVLASEGQAIQNKVVALARSDASMESIAPLLQEAIRAQDRALREMGHLIEMQQVATASILDKSKQEFQHAMWLLLGLTLLVASFALVIQMLVLRRDRALNAELENYQNRLEELVTNRTQELESAIEELKSFAYSLAHDLRQPLRALDGFSLLLAEDYSEKLDAAAFDYLRRIRAASQLMGKLLDGMLRLTRLSRHALVRQAISLSEICRQVVDQPQYRDDNRQVEWLIEDGIEVHADESLMRIALENLLSNSWKFTQNIERARIEFGYYRSHEGTVYYVKDNGAGFDMAYADKLFSNFGRLHSAQEFEGTGIGLATVDRIIKRHGGSIWAQSEPEKGATFFFTLSYKAAPA